MIWVSVFSPELSGGLKYLIMQNPKIKKGPGDWKNRGVTNTKSQEQWERSNLVAEKKSQESFCVKRYKGTLKVNKKWNLKYEFILVLKKKK